MFLGCESVVIYYLSSLKINSCNVSLSGRASIYVDTNRLLSIPANAYNFIVDYFDAVAEIKDWCNGVALFPHEKFFSSLQFFGKSYRTTMLSFISSIIHLNFAAKVQKIFGLSKYLHFNFTYSIGFACFHSHNKLLNFQAWAVVYVLSLGALPFAAS